MKKTALHRSSAAAGQRVLRLSHETIRTLRVEQLARAVSGCDTTSDTTDHTTVHTNSGSALCI